MTPAAEFTEKGEVIGGGIHLGHTQRAAFREWRGHTLASGGGVQVSTECEGKALWGCLQAFGRVGGGARAGGGEYFRCRTLGIYVARPGQRGTTKMIKMNSHLAFSPQVSPTGLAAPVKERRVWVVLGRGCPLNLKPHEHGSLEWL